MPNILTTRWTSISSGQQAVNPPRFPFLPNKDLAVTFLERFLFHITFPTCWRKKTYVEVRFKWRFLCVSSVIYDRCNRADVHLELFSYHVQNRKKAISVDYLFLLNLNVFSLRLTLIIICHNLTRKSWSFPPLNWATATQLINITKFSKLPGADEIIKFTLDLTVQTVWTGSAKFTNEKFVLSRSTQKKFGFFRYSYWLQPEKVSYI